MLNLRETKNWLATDADLQVSEFGLSLRFGHYGVKCLPSLMGRLDCVRRGPVT
jgi:hypothetical protein